MSDEAAVAILRRYYALFNARRLAEASRLIAPDCEFEHVPTREHAHGPRGYLAMAEDWLRAIPDATSVVEDIHEIEPGIYRVRITISGTRVGDVQTPSGLPLAGDGQSFSVAATQRVRIQDGLIVSARLTYDHHRMAGAMDSSPAPPPCPSCGEKNVVAAWKRMHEQGLFCPICEHSWEHSSARAEL